MASAVGTTTRQTNSRLRRLTRRVRRRRRSVMLRRRWVFGFITSASKAYPRAAAQATLPGSMATHGAGTGSAAASAVAGGFTALTAAPDEATRIIAGLGGLAIGPL